MHEIRPHVPEGLTIIFEQKQRKGKTLGGVIWSLDSYQTGRKVFSNIQLGFPHEPVQFHELKLQDGRSPYWNGHIFIDELNFYFDARRSMKTENIEASAFILQQKKQGCHLTGTTHDLMSLDMRIRDNYDYLIVPVVKPEYPAVPEFISMTIHTGPLQEYRRPRTLTLACKPYLGLYDSFAVYDPFKSNGPKPKKTTKKYEEVDL